MIEMLGTLSLDKFIFLGGQKVAADATKHLVTELTDWSCTDLHVCIVYNLHRAERTCSSMSSTCPLPTEAGSCFFFFCPLRPSPSPNVRPGFFFFLFFSLYRLAKTSVLNLLQYYLLQSHC